MNKSIYSLVLADDVIKEVDRMAYELSTSRSNLINQILAEHLSVTTPEMRIKEIFNNVEKLIDSEESLQFQPCVSDSMILLRSILKYKYRPTIKYSVELYRDSEDMIGALKASFRTQSQDLIEAITTFFIIWTELECKYIQKYFPDNKINYEVKEGRFIRQFILPVQKENQSNEKIASAIAEYIHMLNYALRIYFENIDDIERTVKKLEGEYIKWIKDGAIII
jgi:hypothetical protein